ncbi:RNA polymerase subunit sigma-24 [Nonomuraea sp. WAC 01424]|uniref:RNA polymerase sigma factor n=1 Tax=Nonomuraea sp. WAC 01424 TaxID=2203200 RepID=UPI000F79657E|nr:RNA polymerase sigma factor [Nonomuraea sp. WAC 01424]RSN01156.1 RNA polymerase subunit sigma-24 [Nonomuraea sp. WAC 01424]
MGPPNPRQRFEELYTEHYAAVSGYVRRRTDDPHDTADVIAETFTTAWRRRGCWPAGDRARLWLYGVARRTLANHRRGESRREGLGNAELAQVLGCSRIAVRQRLHRARKRLATELAADDPDLARYGSRAVSLAKETS